MPQKSNLLKVVFAVLSLTFAVAVKADPQSEARELKRESLSILKETGNRDATPDEMAKCIYNLEKAAALLESAHDSGSDLATEINSELYWARKRSTLKVDAVLDRLRSGGSLGASTPTPTPSPSPSPKRIDTTANPEAENDAALKAFHDAEKFAQTHTDDDYVVSLHWFQMASTFAGTDWSLKALTLGREAQERFKSKDPNAKKEVIPDTPEMKPLREADELVKTKQWDKAIALYKSSLKMNETIQAHRRLGQAYFNQAQGVWEELMKDRPALAKALLDARNNAYTTRRIQGIDRKIRNPNDPALLAAQKKCADFDKQCDAVFKMYETAKEEFVAVMHLSPSGKDLIADGFIGLCISRKASTIWNAKPHLAAFLKDYTPANDDERSIYEYCKTELDRIQKAKP